MNPNNGLSIALGYGGGGGGGRAKQDLASTFSFLSITYSFIIKH
jgi:hypothetical protein